MRGTELFHILDDRGVRMRVVAQRCAELPRTKRWSVGSVFVDAIILFVIGSLGVLVSAELQPFGLGPFEGAAVLVGACGVVGVLLRWKVLPGMAEVGAGSPATAWLLFLGHCAACGYGMRAIKPQADGCAVCPECGGAWQVARWSWVDTKAGGEAAAVEGSRTVRPTMAAVDDRGVPLPMKLEIPPRWLHRPDLAPTLRHAIEHRWKEAFRTWGGFVLVLSTIICGGVSAILPASGVWTANAWWSVPLLIGVAALCGDVLVFAFFTILVQFPGARSLRREWLEHGVCPNCGCRFAADATPEFDGCTPCRECGRAWRR